MSTPYGAFILAQGNGDTLSNAKNGDLMIYSSTNRILVGRKTTPSTPSYLTAQDNSITIHTPSMIVENDTTLSTMTVTSNAAFLGVTRANVFNINELASSNLTVSQIATITTLDAQTVNMSNATIQSNLTGNTANLTMIHAFNVQASNTYTRAAAISNLDVRDAIISNAIVYDATVANAVIGKSTTTNSYASNNFSSNAFTSQAFIESAAASNLQVSIAATIATLNASNASISNLTFRESVGSFANITSLSASNTYTSNAYIASASASNLYASDSMLVNATITGLAATNATVSNLTFSNLVNVPTIKGITNVETTNVFASNILNTQNITYHPTGGLTFTASNASNASNVTMTMDPKGQVGIGTRAPMYPLDVAGDVNFTGQLMKSGLALSLPIQGNLFLSNLDVETNLRGNNATLCNLAVISVPDHDMHCSHDMHASNANIQYCLDVYGNVNFRSDLYQNGVKTLSSHDNSLTISIIAASNVAFSNAIANTLFASNASISNTITVPTIVAANIATSNASISNTITVPTIVTANIAASNAIITDQVTVPTVTTSNVAASNVTITTMLNVFALVASNVRSHNAQIANTLNANAINASSINASNASIEINLTTPVVIASNLTTSNATIANTLTTPKIIASNITASNASFSTTISASSITASNATLTDTLYTSNVRADMAIFMGRVDARDLVASASIRAPNAIFTNRIETSNMTSSNVHANQIDTSNINATQGIEANTARFMTRMDTSNVYTSNITSTNAMFLGRMTVPEVYASNIYTSNVLASNITATFGNFSNIDFSGKLFQRGVPYEPSSGITSSAGTITSCNVVTNQLTTIGFTLVPVADINTVVATPTTAPPQLQTSVLANNISIGTTVASTYPLNIGTANAQGISAYLSGDIVAQRFTNPSDSRIKKNVTAIDKEEARKLLAALKPCSYDFIDKNNNNNNPSRGFIAQELAKVCPECVSQVSEFIPNIYRNVEVTDGCRLMMTGHEGIKVGDVLKAIHGSITMRLTVTHVNASNVSNASSTIVTVDGLRIYGNTVFVYGTLVHDFNVVSLQPIIALLVAALAD